MSRARGRPGDAGFHQASPDAKRNDVGLELEADLHAGAGGVAREIRPHHGARWRVAERLVDPWEGDLPREREQHDSSEADGIELGLQVAEREPIEVRVLRLLSTNVNDTQKGAGRQALASMMLLSSLSIVLAVGDLLTRCSPTVSHRLITWMHSSRHLIMGYG